MSPSREHDTIRDASRLKCMYGSDIVEMGIECFNEQ